MEKNGGKILLIIRLFMKYYYNVFIYLSIFYLLISSVFEEVAQMDRKSCLIVLMITHEYFNFLILLNLKLVFFSNNL